MAKVEMLTQAAGPAGTWGPGEVVEVDEATAAALIEGGFAKAASGPATTSASGYAGLSVADLRALLADRDLPTTGRKAELIARLEEAEAAAEAGEDGEA